MLILEIYHHKTMVLNADKESLDLVSEALTVFKQKFVYNRFQDTEWEITHLLSYRDFSFPTAYLKETLKFCDEKGIGYSLSDKRKYPSPKLRLMLKKDLELRQDQKDAFHATKTNSTGIIMAPTATGKSRIIAKTIEYRKLRTLLIVPKQNLQDAMDNLLSKGFGKSRIDTEMPWELKERIRLGKVKNESDFVEDHILRKKKISIGNDFTKKEPEEKKKNSNFDDFKANPEEKKKIKISIGDDFSPAKDVSPEDAFIKSKTQQKWDKIKEKQKLKKEKMLERPIKYKDVYIFCDASLDTLPQEFLDQFEMVIIDECHHASARLIRECLLKLRYAAYRYYFSATPWRDHSADEKLLASSIGTDIIYELSPEEAIKIGAIAKPIYTQVNSPEPQIFMKKFKKWRDVLNFGIIGNKSRNKLIVDLAIKEYESGENVFISVEEIAHLDLLVERFKARGIEVETIHGKLPRQHNRDMIKKVGERKSGICLGTWSVGEGTDMPQLTSIILASGGKSTIRLIQRIGRGARLGLDFSKKTFKVFDFNDWFHDTLSRHSFIRKITYQNYVKDYGE